MALNEEKLKWLIIPCQKETPGGVFMAKQLANVMLTLSKSCVEQIPKVSEKLFRVGRLCSTSFTVLNIGPEERCVGFDLTENLITWNLQHFIFEVKPEGNFLKCMCVLFTCQRIF